MTAGISSSKWLISLSTSAALYLTVLIILRRLITTSPTALQETKKIEKKVMMRYYAAEGI